MTASVNSLSTCLKRVEDLGARLCRSQRVRKLIVVLAIAFLVAGIIISFRQHPDILSGLDWRPALLVLLLAVPATVLLNAAEFVVLGKAVGQSVSCQRAVGVTIVGTAANMLPLPGALMVRIGALKAGGAPLRSGSAASLLVSLIWLGIALAYAGCWMLTLSQAVLGAVFALAGLAVLATALVLFSWLSESKMLALQMGAIKTALVILDAVRTLLCFKALGVDANFAQASALTAAVVLGSAFSIVPAGLGIRELLTAALAPLIGLGAAFGFLAATLNRLLGLSVILPIACVLLLRIRKTGNSIVAQGSS